MNKLNATQSANLAQTLAKKALERGVNVDVAQVQKTLEAKGTSGIDSILQNAGFSPLDAEATAAFLSSQVAAPKGKRKSALEVAKNIESGRGTDAFDQLWDKGEYSALVPMAQEAVKTLANTDFAALNLDDLSDKLADLHLLQHRLIGLSNKLSMTDARSDKLATLKLLQDLGPVQSDAFEVTVDKTNEIDDAPVLAWVVHKNTRKKPGSSTYTQRMEYFAKKSREFIAMGGSLKDIKPVSAESLDSFKSGQLLEFVVDETDTARMASADKDPTPGHTLLAMGRDALTAGSLRLYKNDAGEIEQAVVGTFSGHFRAPATTLGHMVRHLVLAGVDPEKISMQGGEAGSARALEIIHRTLGRDGAMIQREQTELDGRASRYNPYALQVQEPGAEKVKVKIDNAKVQDALLDMRQKSAAALADGALIEADRGEVSTLASAIDTVMNEASRAGNPVAFEQAKTLLAFLSGSIPKDSDAKGVLENLSTKWNDHKLGAGLADPADVISRRPADGRRARIVATINPEATKVQLAEMIKAGLDVARFNPAHASIPEIKACMNRVRETAASLGTTVNIQLDLSGPKIRLGKFENPENLEFNDIFMDKGDVLTLTNKPGLGTKKVLPLDLETLGDDVKPGDRLFMNDGLVELVAKEVKQVDGFASVEVEVVQGGKVWDRKGVNMPDSKLSLPTITDDDLVVLDGLAGEIDLLALSFVREPEDILQGREELKKRGVDVPIIAKIERPEAVENLVAIAHLSDGMMVARGDLGVEIGRQNVPRVERHIHKLGNQLGKPTMTATEVLMSMAKGSARATRGDIEALYAAVYDHGADSVMLGKETSYPDEPGRVVREAAIVISEAESELEIEKYSPKAMQG